MSMLIAGACCCGDDEPPPPTCAECPKPNLRLFFSYRGECAEADARNGLMRVTKDSNYIYHFVSTPYPRYVLTSFTETGTWFLSNSCGVTNLTRTPIGASGDFDACLAVEHPRLQTTPFYGSGLRTYTPDCCAPAVPNLPCSEILTNVFLSGIELLTGTTSKLPSGIFLIWDGCNVYADDAAYQEVVRDEQNKVIRIYSESASWGAAVI